ncbi:MAG: hypothetical protein OEY89_18435 [Gammaproteobacteria bacterium]|nr:hypothetical protein [Gammaproteobacteria bacterium]
MLQRYGIYILLLCLSGYVLSVYYSDKRVSERDFSAMLASGHNDLVIIENYLKHHNQFTDVDYDQALRIAASLDAKYLDEIIHYYTIGNLVLRTSTAELILQQLPSDSIQLNYAAGRIYASSEFNQYRPKKAVKHLEYAALRGDKNSAATLSEMYTQASCYIEAITWAKQANKRATSSECTQLPVNINLLKPRQLDAVFHNEDELEAAEKNNRLPVLHYSEHCALNEPD